MRNAIQSVHDAKPDGGGQVVVRSYASDRSAFIEVRDNGPGVPEENWDRVFDPYFSTKQKGSGLGLAISYSIVRRHGGCMDIGSELGRGTTVLIYLPVATEPPTLLEDVDPEVVGGDVAVEEHLVREARTPARARSSTWTAAKSRP